MSRWLITGGCGFVGLGFIRYLINYNPERVIILDNLSNSSLKDLLKITQFSEFNPNELKEFNGENKFIFIKGDIQDSDLMQIITKEIDICIHLAANTGVPKSVADPVFDFELNVKGTFNILNACRINKVKRFVFASSGAPAGVIEPPIHENLAIRPCSPYGASKATGESYCSSFFHAYGIETVALRFSNVYGPGSKKKESVVAKFIKECIAQKPIYIYGDGSQTRDFIYIDDLSRAIYQSSVVKSIGGEVIQIATSVETSIKELIGLIGEALKEYKIELPPVKISEKRPGDIYRNYSIIEKANKMLKWEPKINLKKGIDLTVAGFVK